MPPPCLASTWAAAAATGAAASPSFPPCWPRPRRWRDEIRRGSRRHVSTAEDAAAVDAQDLAGDVARERRGEEDDRAGDVFGGGDAAEGDAGQGLVPPRAGERRRRHVGVDPARSHRVDAHPRRQLDGPGAGGGDHRPLAGGIGAVARLAALAGGRGQVDDVAVGGELEQRQCRRGAEERAGDVDRQRLVEDGAVEVAERARHPDAGVVDQDVERPPLGGDEGEHRLDLRRVAQVAASHEVRRRTARGARSGAQGAQLLEQRRGPIPAGLVVDEHGGAGAGEEAAARRADAAAAAGHQHPAAAEVDHCTVSTSMAIPCPPPMQAEATPAPPPRRPSSLSKVISRRVPEAPSGWPSAMAPPLTLSLSTSSCSSRITARIWPANASLISIRSRSPSSMPLLASTARIAGAGPMPMRDGSTPTTDQPRMRPIGFQPCSSACSAVESSIIAAPSTMPEALPAVTKPSLSKAGGSAARSSMVLSGRRWSSRSISFAFLPLPTSTGTTSSESLQLAQAAPARRCESSANSSWSARVMP